MKPKKSSYIFVTIPSPLVGPEAASDGQAAPANRAADTAAPCHNGGTAPSAEPASLTHTTPTGFAQFTAAATGVADPRLCPAAAAASGAPDGASRVFAASTTAAVAHSPRAGAAAAGPSVGCAVSGRAAYQRAVRRGRSRSSISTVRHTATALHEAAKSRSEARAASLQTHQRSSSDAAEEQHQDVDTGLSRPAACPYDASAVGGVPCSSNGSALGGVTPASNICLLTSASGSEGSSTASSVSTGQHGQTRRLPQPSLFSSEPCPPSGFDDSPSIRAGTEAPGKPLRRAATAAIGHSTPRRSQRRGSRDRQKSTGSSNSPGVTVPSFADAALPPLAVEDAAMMLREFATLLQRLECSGQQALQHQKQPQSVRTREQMRQRLSPQERLQQQAVVCSSLSARLQRLFEASEACRAKSTSPGTPRTVAATPGDDSPQKKPRHHLLLPGVRSRAGIQEAGSGEEGWPDGASSNRIALRTLGTFSTMGSNSSASFELTGAHVLPRSSLEQHRGRLRLAKLKEDFERLQQKHERLVTLYNIRMLLPLSRRNGSGVGQSVENCSAASSREGEAADAPTRSKEQAAAVAPAGDALPEHLTTSGKETSEGIATVETTDLGGGDVADAAAEGTGILDSLDFSHFADYSGHGVGTSALTQGPLLYRRRRSSSTTSCWGGANSRSHRRASGAVGGPCKPLHSLLRYTSSGTTSSSSSSSSGVRQRALVCSTESGLSRFYSLNDPNSLSFGDSLLPPIYLGPSHEGGRGNVGVSGTDGSVSRSTSSAQGAPQRQERQQSQWGVHGSKKFSADFGARWRRGESSLLFPGEASLENVWRPTRLQEIDEGFEEQQRREQLQQLQHIEECVHVLHELHVQIADEVETAEKPLAAVAAETDAAAVQTAQANRELVTASLRRSRWWGVQGGGVAAAAGVVVGGLAGGPIGAAVGLVFGAFLGATSGSAMEREHRHRLSRLVRGKTRRKKKGAGQAEQDSQSGSTGLPGADQQQQVYRGEQELVSRARGCETADGGRDISGGGDRLIRGRATVETQRAQPKDGQSCGRRQLRMGRGQFPVSTTTLPYKAGSAVPPRHVEQQGQQRQDERLRPVQQERPRRRDVGFLESNGASSSSIAAPQHTGRASSSSARAVDSRCGTRNGAAIYSSDCPAAAESGRPGLHPNSGSCTHLHGAGASTRRGGGHPVKHVVACRRKDDHISRNVPLPALLGLGWRHSSVWVPEERIREAAGPHSTNRGLTTPRRQQGSLP